MDEEQQTNASNQVDGKDCTPVSSARNHNYLTTKMENRKLEMKKIHLKDFKLHTFVKDISSGTIYGEGFKNGARSMYISKSSELRCISSIHIPLLETGFANSQESCLEIKKGHQFRIRMKKAKLKKILSSFTLLTCPHLWDHRVKGYAGNQPLTEELPTNDYTEEKDIEA